MTVFLGGCAPRTPSSSDSLALGRSSRHRSSSNREAPMTARTSTFRAGGVAKPARDPGLRSSQHRHPTARMRSTPKRSQPTSAYYVLAIIMAILTLLGLVMVLSASSVIAVRRIDAPSQLAGWSFFRRQLVWAALGAMALAIAVRVPVHRWRKLLLPGLVVSFALMVATLVPGIGREVNGARSWISLGPIGFQPSELMKLALLVYSADLLARRADQMGDTHVTLRPLLIVLAGACALMVLQRDLGSAIVLSAVVFSVAFIAGSPLRALAKATAAMATAAVVFVISTPYRRARWTAFLNIEGTKSKDGFQVFQALIGIASGGVTGVGLGASKAKWGFLPEAHTDFIFAIISEELGLVGVVLVCALFVLLAIFGVQVANKARDRFSMLVAGGVTAWFVVQAVINIGGVTGMMPLTGLTLPFVSFGGTSLLVTMAGAGLLLNVARTAR